MASDKIDFRSVGQIAQAMKETVRDGDGWQHLSSVARESIDQILSSIARMVTSGQSVHWDGIMAYADSAKPATAAVEPEALKTDRSQDYPYTTPPVREKGQDELIDAMQRLAKDRVQRNTRADYNG